MGPVAHTQRTTDGLAAKDGVNLRTLFGFHVDADGPAEVQIRDGSATGDIIATSRLATAADDGPFWFGPQGIATAGGIWVEIVSGSPTVTVYGV